MVQQQRVKVRPVKIKIQRVMETNRLFNRTRKETSLLVFILQMKPNQMVYYFEKLSQVVPKFALVNGDYLIVHCLFEPKFMVLYFKLRRDLIQFDLILRKDLLEFFVVLVPLFFCHQVGQKEIQLPFFNQSLFLKQGRTMIFVQKAMTFDLLKKVMVQFHLLMVQIRKVILFIQQVLLGLLIFNQIMILRLLICFHQIETFLHFLVQITTLFLNRMV